MLVAVAQSPGGYRLVPFPPERKAIDIGDFYADSSKIARVTGWRPTVSLREGLARTVAFYRQHYTRVRITGTTSERVRGFRTQTFCAVVEGTSTPFTLSGITFN